MKINICQVINILLTKVNQIIQKLTKVRNQGEFQNNKSAGKILLFVVVVVTSENAKLLICKL